MKEKIIDVPQGNPEKQKKILIAVVVIIVAIILGTNCTYTVKENEQAVLLTLGNASTISESGLHFKIPFVQKVKKVDTSIQGFTMGYDQTSNETIEEESLMITSDFNFVNVDFYVEYKVSDPIKYLYNSQQPEYIFPYLNPPLILTPL